MIPLLRRTPLKRRPLPYRRRARRPRAAAPRESHPVIQFEPPRGELPVAKLRDARSSLLAEAAAGLGAWFAARLAWLRPRALPVAVALVGMLAVLNAVNYLAKPPAAKMSSSASSMVDAQPTYNVHIKVVLQQ